MLTLDEKQEMQAWSKQLTRFGLRLNVKKIDWLLTRTSSAPFELLPLIFRRAMRSSTLSLKREVSHCVMSDIYQTIVHCVARNRVLDLKCYSMWLVYDSSTTFSVSSATVCKTSFKMFRALAKGRPRQRWLETVHSDFELVGIHPEQEQDWTKLR